MNNFHGRHMFIIPNLVYMKFLLKEKRDVLMNPGKHLKWSVLLKTHKYFRKTFHVCPLSTCSQSSMARRGTGEELSMK